MATFSVAMWLSWRCTSPFRRWMAAAWSGAALGERICLPTAIWAWVVASLFWMVLMRSVARSNKKEVEIFIRRPG